MNLENTASAAMSGCNSHSFVLSRSAQTCLMRFADYGFEEVGLMVHPGNLWPAEQPLEWRRLDSARRT